MVLLGSLLDQFVSSFDRAYGLSIFQFDAVQFIDFSAKDFDRWVQIPFNGLETVVLSLISENPRSRFLLELMLLLC